MGKNPFGLDDVSHRIESAIELTLRDGAISAKNHFIKSFTDGGFTDRTLEKWEPRKRETRRTIGKGILINRGHLRRSIRVQVQDTRHFIIVSDMGLATRKDYAPVHNYGLAVGASKHTNKILSFGKKGGFVKAKKANTQMRVSYSTKGFTMPQRRFMGRSEVLENKIREKLIRNINSCFK